MSSASFDVLVAVRLESADFCFDVAQLLVDIREVFGLGLKLSSAARMSASSESLASSSAQAIASSAVRLVMVSEGSP